jgi:hypothetical protein
MTEQNADAADAQIISTLTFDTDERFRDYEPYRLLAEGIHERGERSVRVTYVLDTEVDDERQLIVKRFFRIGGERKNQGSAETWDLTWNGGLGDGYTVDYNGQSLQAFIRDEFESDPEVELGEAFAV